MYYFNRTIVELKQANEMVATDKRKDFNRTIVELKQANETRRSKLLLF